MAPQAIPFEIDIPESQLTDLRQRLENIHWAPDLENDDWRYGTNGAYLAELVDYWLGTYDWRKQERAMNAYDHFRVELDGSPIHFLHAKGQGPAPLPLILSHGWPWTFWDFEKVIGPLSDPAAYGGDPKDAFDVVVPSLPGFGFSTPLTKTGINWWRTADLWAQLMRDVLGYERFCAHGGDWGSLVTLQLGHRYADRVHGIHITGIAPLDIFSGERPWAIGGALESMSAGSDERAEMLEGFGLGEGALFRMVRSAYHLLGLRTYLTTGEKETRAWTFYEGSTAPICAGRIHTDFQRGFIRAEVIQWDELLELGSWNAAKDVGRLRVEGKDYIVQDGDVMEFRFNV